MARTNVTTRVKGDAKKQKKQKLAVDTENTNTMADIPVTTAKRAISRKRCSERDWFDAAAEIDKMT